MLGSAVAYLGLAAALTANDKPDTPAAGQDGLSFDEVLIDYTAIPPLQSFVARDGQTLFYRRYPAESDKVLVLLHCSGWHSQYLMPLAEFISSTKLAEVYTPDLRGHGPQPARRGDVDYIGQLEDDLADFITLARKDNPGALVILGGHSSGGGLVIRYAGGLCEQPPDAYWLMAPYLHYMAPTFRPNSGGWAFPYIKRLLGLMMFNAVGIRRFNHLPIMQLNMPAQVCDGSETRLYSYRLYLSCSPRNYQQDLRKIKQPLLVLAGTDDEAFVAEQYEPVMSRCADAQVQLVEGVTHMGLVASDQVRPVVETWLQSLDRL
jgi:non-heme chloroperoxidase